MKEKININILKIIMVYVIFIFFVCQNNVLANYNLKINELNYLLMKESDKYESYKYNFYTGKGGKLEIVVPLNKISENGEWKVSLYYEKDKFDTDFSRDIVSGKFVKKDVNNDLIILKGYIPSGNYIIDFYGDRAICSVNFIEDNINDEIENNNNFEIANYIDVNIPKNGSLGFKGDNIDCFTFNVEDAGLFNIDLEMLDLSGRSSFYGINSILNDKIKLFLYKEDESGNLINIYHDKNFEIEEIEKFIKYKLITPKIWLNSGKYYIKIESTYQVRGIYYKLNPNFISDNSVKLENKVENNTSSNNSNVNSLYREKENNNIYLNATDIVENIDYFGNLEGNYDIDWYRIKLDYWSYLNILFNTPRQNYDNVYEITLYRMFNNELRELDKTFSRINNVSHETINKLYPKGEYYIKIKTGQKALSDVELSNQDYKLKVETKYFDLLAPIVNLKQAGNKYNPNICVKTIVYDDADQIEIFHKKGNGSEKYYIFDINNENINYIKNIDYNKYNYVKVRSKKELYGEVIYSPWSSLEKIKVKKSKKSNKNKLKTGIYNFTYNDDWACGVEVKKVTKNTIKFRVAFLTNYPFRVYETNTINAKIKNNICTFKWKDSHNGRGKGKLEIRKDSIKLTMTPINANWGVKNRVLKYSK